MQRPTSVLILTFLQVALVSAVLVLAVISVCAALGTWISTLSFFQAFAMQVGGLAAICVPLALAMRLRGGPITRARSKDEVPLSTALGLMVRERLTGGAPPAAAAMGMALVQDWLEEKVGSDLDALGLAIDDQAAFADLSRKLLRDLELAEGEMMPDDTDEGVSDDEGQD